MVKNHNDDTQWILKSALVISTLALLSWFIPMLLLFIFPLLALLASCILGYVLIRMGIKLVRENRGPNGLLYVWRPTLSEALREIGIIYLWWLPFGVATVLMFHAHGLLVGWLGELCAAGIQWSEARAGDVSHHAKEFGHGAWPTWAIPGPLIEAVNSLDKFAWNLRSMLGHALALLVFLLVLESWFSWMFLVWVTARTILCFAARRVLSRDHAGKKTPMPLETRFDMEFLR